MAVRRVPASSAGRTKPSTVQSARLSRSQASTRERSVPQNVASRASPPFRATQKLSASASRSDEAAMGPGVLGDNSNLEAGANIKVVVRCRGISATEKTAEGSDGKVVLHTEGMRGSVLTVTVGEERDEERRAFPLGPNVETNKDKAPTTKSYPFDHVFGPEADQALIYNDVVAPIVKEVIQGYNCTVFAYGQTGTGKTYTMTGDLSTPAAVTALSSNPPGSGRSSAAFLPAAMAYAPEAGIIPRVLHQLFALLENDEAEYAVRVSFVELYNEEVRDLNGIAELPPPAGRQHGNPANASSATSDPTGASLKIFDDTRRGTFIQGLEETPISSAADGIRILTRGSARRQMASTRCNEQSSRSHSIFTITVHVKEPVTDGARPKSGKSTSTEDLLKVGKLNLVDLAGSENVGRSGAGKEGGRAREAGMINQSLLALGRVINALVEKSNHVPYRESKLTRLLQDSLGGRTKTCIIATVSPARLNLEETLSTLDYAICAKSIRNRPELNARMTKHALINQYVQELERLKLDLIAARERNGIWLSPESWQDLSSEHEARKLALIDAKRQVEVYEHHVATARESLEQSLRLLGLRDQEMKRISDELASTTGLLRATEDKASDLGDRWQDEQIMRQAFQESRFAWKKWATSAHDDAEGLRAKIERKTAVELANRDTVSQAAGAFAAMSREFDAQLRTFATSHADRSRHIQHSLSDFAMAQCSALATQHEYLADRLRSLIDSAIFSHEHLKHSDAQARGFAEGVAAAASNIVEAMSEGAVILAQHTEARKKEVRRCLQSLDGNTAAFVSAVATSTNKFVQAARDHSDEEIRLLSAAAATERQAFEDENAKLTQCIKELETQLDAERRHDAEDEAALIELLRDQNQMRVKRHEGTAAMWRKRLEEQRDFGQQRSATHVLHLDRQQSDRQAVLADLGVFAQDLLDASKEHQKIAELTSNMLCASIDSQESVFAARWTGRQTSIVDGADVLKREAKRFGSDAKAARTELDAFLSDVFARTRETYEGIQSELTDVRDGVESAVKSLLEEVSKQLQTPWIFLNAGPVCHTAGFHEHLQYNRFDASW